MKSCLLATIGLFLGITFPRADPDDVSEGQRWWSHVQHLASDAMEGRDTGSDAYARAAEYVAQQFAAAGLQPAGTEGFFQKMAFDVSQIFEEQSSLELIRDGLVERLSLADDANLRVSPEMAEQIEAPAVFVGHGLVIPELGIDDLAGLDLKGKIAIFLSGGPKSIPGPVKAHFSATKQRWQTLRQAGAIGVASLLNPKSRDVPWPRATLARLNPSMTLSDPKLNDQAGRKVTLQINPAQADRFLAGTGHTIAELLQLADADQPLPRFPLAVTIRAKVAAKKSTVTSMNVVGLLPGADPKLKQEYVVLSAHLDHLGTGEPINGDRIYNGALDNAAGVASLLRIADRFQATSARPKRSILFLALTGEEKGLQGSKFFANYPTVPQGGLVANLNTDMVLPLYPLKSLRIYGADESSLGDQACAVCSTSGVRVQPDPEPDRNVFIRSDQYNFILQGIPALAFKFGSEPNSPEEKLAKAWLTARYHAPSDDLDQPVDKSAAAEFNEVLLKLIQRIADEPERPTWKPDSFFARFTKPMEQSPSPAAGAAISDWHGYRKHSFSLEGHACFVVEPKIAAPGKPWVWRTSFPDFHAEIDRELLHHGCHVGYIDCVDLLGSDRSLELMDRYYDVARQEWQLSARPALEAVSRGGLHAYRYAARRPQRVACLYADTPVMDLKSWPRQWPGSQKEWQEAMKVYGFANEAAALAFQGNPLDILAEIAREKIPLRHVISLNDRVVPPQQNTLEARRRLRAIGYEMEVVSVPEGTPESSGHHFPLPEVFASTRFILEHTHVLPKHMEYLTRRIGLANSQASFLEGKTGRIAFLGGSITFNPGWRNEIMDYFKRRFPETAFDFVAAGIPSLGSVPDAFRLRRDILAHGPVDLLFVEAAVNDTTNETNSQRMLRGMEGIVRQVRLANPLTDIVQMHFVMPEHMADYRAGRVPASIDQHERVAERYGCPSLNLSLEVTDRIAALEFTWENEFRDVHPSPYGQRLYANSIARLLDHAFQTPILSARPHLLPSDPIDPQSYFRGRLGRLEEARLVQGFRLFPSWKPEDGKGVRDGFVNVPALVATEPASELEVTFDGTGVGLFVTSGPDAGIVEYSTDGGGWKKVDTFTAWSPALHLPWAVMLDDELSPGQHVTRVRVSAERHLQSRGTALRIFHFLFN